MVFSLMLFVLASARDPGQGLHGKRNLLDDRPVFSPTDCQNVCTRLEDYHVPLPTSPNAAIGNAATRWGVALLVQVISRGNLYPGGANFVQCKAEGITFISYNNSPPGRQVGQSWDRS